MDQTTLIRLAAKLENLSPLVKDIDMRLRRLEKGYWMAMGAFAILELVRACR